MTSPWWVDDDELLGELHRALEPVPASFVEAGKMAFTWRSIDAELAALTYDSSRDLVGAEQSRAEPAALRCLTFDATHRRAGDRARRATRAARPTRAGHRGDPAGRWQRQPGGGGRGGLLHLDAGTDRHVPTLLRPRRWRGHSHRLDHAVALP